MSEWAKKMGARSTPVFKNIEIRTNLPTAWE